MSATTTSFTQDSPDFTIGVWVSFWEAIVIMDPCISAITPDHGVFSSAIIKVAKWEVFISAVCCDPKHMLRLVSANVGICCQCCSDAALLMTTLVGLHMNSSVNITYKLL